MTTFTDKTDGVDDVLAAYVNALQDAVAALETGWIAAEETWTYASASTFTVSGDKRTKYPVGTKIKLTQTTVKYFYVVGTAYSSNTTVTVTGGSDYTLANAAISSPYFSYSSTPQDFPQWFAYTPTLTGGAADLSGYTTAKFAIAGRVCQFYFSAENKSMSGSAGSSVVTLPVASAAVVSFPFTALAYPGTGSYALIRTAINAANLVIYKDINGNNWTASETGVYLFIQGTYQI